MQGRNNKMMKEIDQQQAYRVEPETYRLIQKFGKTPFEGYFAPTCQGQYISPFIPHSNNFVEQKQF